MDVEIIKKPIPKSDLERRFGRFSIASFLAEAFEYIALSELFDSVPQGSIVPDYQIQINVDTQEVMAIRRGKGQDFQNSEIISMKRKIDF